MFINTSHLTRPRCSTCVWPFSSWALDPISPSQLPVSPGVLLKKAVHLDYATVLFHLPVSTSPLPGALLPHVPPVRLDLPSGSTSSHELSSHTPVDDAVWIDGHHTQSQLVSQRRSQSLGPDSVSSTTSFSQGPLCGISKYLTQNLALGIILTLGNFLKLYSENCHAKKLFWLLFYDGEEVSLFCQPTPPFCTFLISMGELEFEGQFNTWSILRHSVIIVQQAWIVFKIAN